MLLRKDSIFCPSVQRGPSSSACGGLGFLKGDRGVKEHWNIGSVRVELLACVGCVRLPELKLSRTPLNQDVGDSRYISDDQVQSPNEAIP
jgi:hypothetical protein